MDNKDKNSSGTTTIMNEETGRGMSLSTSGNCQEKKRWFKEFKNFGQWFVILILCIVFAGVIFAPMWFGLSRIPDVFHNFLVVTKVQLNEESSAGGQCTYFFSQKEEKGYKIKFTVTSICGLYQVNDKVLLAKGK